MVPALNCYGRSDIVLYSSAIQGIQVKKIWVLSMGFRVMLG